MRRLLTVVVVTLAISGAASAQDGVTKYRNYTPEQIAALPDAVRSEEVPLRYIFATRSGMSLGSEILFGMYLNSLMYPGIHDYAAAVRQFQRDLGEKQDGELTVWQISTLERRAQIQKLSSVLVTKRFSSYITSTSASIKGTFIIVDDKIAWPINLTTVSCSKSEGYCTVDQTYIDVPDENSFSQNYALSQAIPEYYRITNWTKDTIDAAPDADPDACRVTTMNLNFATKEFYQITRNATRECSTVLGVQFPRLDRPRIAQIVDGDKLITEEFAKIAKAAFDVLSAEVRARIEKLSAEAPPQSAPPAKK